MAGRVEGKVAIVVGGGQTPGETVGNGRATAMRLAQEGAKVVVADRDLASAEETVKMIAAEGGIASAVKADAIVDSDVRDMVAATIDRYGKLDILHNNVGASISLGDARLMDIEEAAFDRSFAVNLKSHWLSCKYALPHLCKNGGSIVNISSFAAKTAYPLLGYKTMKAAVIALTENIAAMYAADGVRANAVLPGLINTPMAVESRVKKGIPRAEVIAERDVRIPLRRKMGTAWDVANAALFLHSDEANFITGISLIVDGGEMVCAAAHPDLAHK